MKEAVSELARTSSLTAALPYALPLVAMVRVWSFHLEFEPGTNYHGPTVLELERYACESGAARRANGHAGDGSMAISTHE